MTSLNFKFSSGKSWEFFPANFNLLRIGKEAVMDLKDDPFSKKSLNELVKRGDKQGKMIEVPFNKNAIIQLENLKLKSAHGKEPQLKKLFQTEFTKLNRLFVFISEKEEWLAAVMLFQISDQRIQTELLLRNVIAKTGVMEALIFNIYNMLKGEGFLYWSLGAVPFIKTGNFKFRKNYFYNFLGRRIKFAYNYRGLFHFKNKFNPLWKDYYLFTSNKINLRFLLKVAVETNLFSLLIYKLKYPFRNLLLKEN